MNIFSYSDEQVESLRKSVRKHIVARDLLDRLSETQVSILVDLSENLRYDYLRELFPEGEFSDDELLTCLKYVKKGKAWKRNSI